MPPATRVVQVLFSAALQWTTWQVPSLHPWDSHRPAGAVAARDGGRRRASTLVRCRRIGLEGRRSHSACSLRPARSAFDALIATTDLCNYCGGQVRSLPGRQGCAASHIDTRGAPPSICVVRVRVAQCSAAQCRRAVPWSLDVAPALHIHSGQRTLWPRTLSASRPAATPPPGSSRTITRVI